MRYAVALSEHTDPRVAVAEAIGQILDRIGTAPDLAALFVSGSHVSSVRAIAKTVRQGLEPGSLIGSTATSVLAHRSEVEARPAVVIWAGHTGPVELRAAGKGAAVTDAAAGSTLMVLANPLTFDAPATLESIPAGVTLVGGFSSGTGTTSPNSLIADDEILLEGSVLAVLPEGLGIRPLVSQGCRAVGDPFTITAASDNLILELGGRSAVDRLEEIVTSCDPADRRLMADGLQVGLAIVEHAGMPRFGDFLMRDVLGTERSRRAVAVAGIPTVGTTAQFHVRDAEAASMELAGLLQPLRADSALVFTCNGRGTRYFRRPNHDAESFCDGLDTTSVAGMFCAGELGPTGRQHFVHGFTASGLLFGASELS